MDPSHFFAPIKPQVTEGIILGAKNALKDSISITKRESLAKNQQDATKDKASNGLMEGLDVKEEKCKKTLAEIFCQNILQKTREIQRKQRASRYQ